MLIVLYTVFFSLVCTEIAVRYKKEIVEILPVVFSAFVLLLYILAFINRMWFADIIALAAVLAIIIKEINTKEKNVFQKYTQKLFKPSVIVFSLVCIVGVIALSDRGIWSNDDLAFWSIDTKTIFSLQGFSAFGLQTVPEYGDYPPVSQIIEAWFMHIVGKYDEGLMFSAYFLAMQIYTAPILKNMPSKIITSLMSFVWLFFIYSFGPNILFDLSADVLMGIIYGSVMVLAFYWKNKTGAEYLSLGIMLSVLTLTKSVGIQWAAFALIFILLMEHPVLKFKKQQLWLATPVLSWLSWNVFCRISGRTTYLTQLLKSSVTGQSSQDMYLEYGEAMKKSFFKALKFNQQTSTANLGLGTTDFIVLFLVFLIIWWAIKLIDRHEFGKIFTFMLVTGVAEYAILLFSVLTMFIHETWYTEYEFMLVLLKRYGAPYIIGFLLVVVGVLFERINDNTLAFIRLKFFVKNKKTIIWIAVIAVQLLFVPFEQEIKKYVTYRDNEAPVEYDYNEAVYQKNIEEQRPYFISSVNALGELTDFKAEKILIIHDETVWKQYELRNLRYYVAPLCIYSEIADNIDVQSMTQLVADNKFTGICFISDDTGNNIPKQLGFDDNTETFKVYRINTNNNQLSLAEM